MRKINFLDCTLRDGAHVVSGNFGKKNILNVISKLTMANIDVIEIGFLKTTEYHPDKIFYPKIENAYALLEETGSFEENNNSMYAVMARADEYNIAELSPSDGRIKLIRVAFYADFLKGGIDFVKKAMKLGYLCSINLINTPGSSLQELKEFIRQVNEITPFAVSIVDTFGVMSLSELKSIVELYDTHLNPGINLGLHVHENLSLSFPMAQIFIEMTQGHRSVILDGSLMGIGRAPGNLCTELAIHYLNEKINGKYNTDLILSAISESIRPFKKKFRWGYAPEFYLSAKHRVHRSYAEYLEKNGISLDKIDLILGEIDADQSKKYNKDYVVNLAIERGFRI